MATETENERGLECAIVKMALSAQEVDLSPDDLPTMRRLTKTLQRYLHLTENTLAKKNLCRRRLEGSFEVALWRVLCRLS